MTTPESTPERSEQPQANVPKEVEVRAEEMEIAPHVERATGMKPTTSQFTAQVQDDQGNQIMHSPANTNVTITLPTSQQNLKHWSDGKISESVTWFALYWLRILKKAAQNGWKVVNAGQTNNQNDGD